MALPSRPRLSAITQEMTLNRNGLVADCIFPPVETGCKFSYIDWTAELAELKSIADHVTCKTDANEIDVGNFALVDKSTKDHALMQVLDECCLDVCGDNTVNAKVEAMKTRSLGNKLLISREQRAINLATDVTKYTSNATKPPTDSTAVFDGGLFNITATDFNNPNFGLLRWFQSINEHVMYGARNVMVTDLATLNAMLVHPNFIGSGCVVDPMTSPAKLASLLGLSKICIADAKYNDGLGETVTMKKMWPANTILFTSSYEFITSVDPQFSFGLTAYSQGIEQNNWVDPKKGKGDGALMQKMGHDMTEVVLSYLAATLVKITA